MSKLTDRKKKSSYWKLILPFLIVVLLLGLAASAGANFEKSFSYGADATIVADNRYGTYGHWQNCYVSGPYSDLGERSTLLMWNISSLPKKSEIKEATIYLRGTNGSDDKFNVYGLRKKWLEYEVSWQKANDDTYWSLPGASGSWDRYTYGVRSFWPNETTRVATVHLDPDLVQSWLSSSQYNYGVIIVAATNYAELSFRCSESSYSSLRPELVIEYDY